MSNFINKKLDNVEYKYICIKKEFFDVNMIYLNYTNMKKRKYIEIIYKSPSIFLEGLFFKTPPLTGNNIYIIYKDRQINNITIKLYLDKNEFADFINMINSIDGYIKSYISRYAKDINNELNASSNNGTLLPIQDGINCINNIQELNIQELNIQELNNLETIDMFRYDNILRKRGDHWELNLKSYLDRHILEDLKKYKNNKYIFTFNISNIYFGNSSLIPLVKCNKCDIC
jgi:hypothetical protein